ncbi:MAG: amidohydrolase family protein [Gemmatimonadetes bacterium]|nr:amidohydrolase family protein [Gemmatimonadota bacterium]MYH51356.1 amidohydrolase family protein [Gemmatimonadota bacterium]MYK65385.1 amidohydrolase family protein [Gemmatimonadota bacterium]
MPMTSPTGKLSTVFLASAFAFSALAATLPPTPLAAQEGAHAHTGMYDGPTVLRAARLLDVETGEMHTNAVIVVEDGVITAVNPNPVPDVMHDMDLGDVTLLPGFIDAHTHLAGEISATSFTDAVTRTEAYGAINAVRFGAITVRAGFTTVRDFGGDVTVELGKAVERGIIDAPRVIPSRYPLGITGGHCDVTGFAPGIREGGPEEGVADGPWEVVEAVRYQIKHGAKVIKTCATAGVLSMEGPVGAQQYSLEELTAMVEEAARHGIKVAAHAHGSEGILVAVQAGVASIEHGSVLTDEIMDLMIEKGTYLVPTTYLVDRIPLNELPAHVRAKAEDILPHARASVQRAIERGVPIAFGTDAGVFTHGENAGEFGIYVGMGMSELDALRTATIHAADLLDTPDRGRLAEGMLADIIAVPGNPLDDIEVTKDVQFVMLGGRVIKHVMGGRDMHSMGH